MSLSKFASAAIWLSLYLSTAVLAVSKFREVFRNSGRVPSRESSRVAKLAYGFAGYAVAVGASLTAIERLWKYQTTTETRLLVLGVVPVTVGPLGYAAALVVFAFLDSVVLGPLAERAYRLRWRASK